VATIAAFFIVAFLGLVLGHSLPRNLHPSRDEQCEPLATDKDPSAAVLEPQNTWSNWAYLLAGSIILYRSRNLLGAFVGLNLAFEFLFSALYHSKLTESMQFIDVAWIYVLVLSLIVCAAQCVVTPFHDAACATELPDFSNWRFLVSLAIAAATIFIGMMIRVIRPDSTITTILLAGTLAAVLSFTYLWKLLSNLIQAIWPPELPDWHVVDTVDIILIFVFGLTALTFRFSDGPGHILFDWCTKDEGKLQPHAVWHVASALLVLVAYDFFCHYFPGQGRVFANWLADE
jgi:hypothetical protein